MPTPSPTTTIVRNRRLAVLFAGSFVIGGLAAWLTFSQLERLFAPLGRSYDACRDTRMVMEAITEYVAQQKKWPISWDDLRAGVGTSVVLPSGGWQEFQSYVNVDFSLTLDDVGQQSARDFRAIKSREPMPPIRLDEVIDALLSTVRKVTQAEAGVGQNEPE